MFTRENFVVHDGLPYDYQAAMQRVMEEQSGNVGIWQDTSGPNGWFTSQRAHEIFDKLAGVDPANRKRSDRLPHTTIKTLREWLTDSDAEKLVTWSHKFLAHAADGVSRQKVDMATVTPSLNKLTDVLRCFIRVSEAVLAYLLFDSGHGMIVPVPQFDQFERLACPLLAYGKETELCEHWDKLSKERNDFLEGTLGSLTST